MRHAKNRGFSFARNENEKPRFLKNRENRGFSYLLGTSLKDSQDTVSELPNEFQAPTKFESVLWYEQVFHQTGPPFGYLLCR